MQKKRKYIKMDYKNKNNDELIKYLVEMTEEWSFRDIFKEILSNIINKVKSKLWKIKKRSS